MQAENMTRAFFMDKITSLAQLPKTDEVRADLARNLAERRILRQLLRVSADRERMSHLLHRDDCDCRAGGTDAS
jgi:hypothetical protein